MASALPMNRARFVVPPLGDRGASDRLKPALRAKTVSWSQYAPKKASGLSMNREKPHAKGTISPLTPRPLPVEGRGRSAGRFMVAMRAENRAEDSPARRRRSQVHSRKAGANSE